MQKEVYDIEKVKEYFRYYLFPGLGNNSIAIDKWGEKVKWSRINYILLFLLPFFFFVFDSRGMSLIGMALFLGIMWGLSLFSYLFTEYLIKRYTCYKALDSYFTVKILLQSFLENFKKSTNTDIFSEGMDPIQIQDIQNNLQNISKVLSLITGPLIEFRKLGPQLPIEARNVLEKFITIEVRWLVEYIREFREVLATWMEVHQGEISHYQKNELNEKNNKIFSLVSTRLNSHIENIEKVRITI